MKIFPMFLLLMAINITLLMYSYAANQTIGTSQEYLGSDGAETEWDSVNPGYSQLNTYGATNSSTGTFNSMDFWNAFLNPSGGNNARIVVYIIAFALLIGALGFVPFVNRSDLSVLSGPFIVFIAIAGPTIVGLWAFINGQVSAYVCHLSYSCFLSNLMGAIIAGTLFVAWILACLEWWSGRPVS